MADEIDEATLGLMIELQLQDAQSLTKGKNRSSEILQDSELAGWLFEQELQALESFRVAQAMSRSIAHALSTDDAAIKTLTFREEQAHRDREYAIHGQDSVNYPVPASTSTPVPPIEDRTTVEKPVPSYMNESRPPSAAEPSSTQSARAGPSVQAVREPEMRNCVACMSDAPVHWCTRCPCSHDYCRECLTTLFENAISDESLFPPKCCKEPIPISLTTSILPWTLVEAFNAKEKEFGTANRTYCHTPTCSAFIPEQSIWEDVATCIKCGSRTCAICKRESHHGDCPDDSATAELLRTAAAQGWQRCYSCHRVVDLKAGCNHISTFQILPWICKSNS
ncbi:hypothetical protein QQS21_003104 [Conoideocrella luteorostrata]|uniref:RBR-type E3 ubiquitin transferase n=1 Tax=Conoideocrella luteorostrata TaxID=1105319 RepID=A0AAJ0FWQ9_9HYPO|nr:hypothetical protein QQS21_003104 [Conoideocrella luteorostrata]